MAAIRTFLQANSSTADLTTYTFASENLGAAASGRFIVALVQARSVNALTLSSASVGGVSATIAVQASTSGAPSNLSAIVIAAVPSGTTGDVVITFNAAAVRCAVQLYRVLGIDGLTASDTDSSVASPPSASIDIPAGGVAFAGAFSASVTTCTWTNLTEDFDGSLESINTTTSASDEFATLQSALAITATFASASVPVGVFASWGPAAVGGSSLPVFISHYRQQGIM